MAITNYQQSFHYDKETMQVFKFTGSKTSQLTKYTYEFFNHFHPFVEELLQQLNEKSVPGLLDVNFHAGLERDFFVAEYLPSAKGDSLEVKYHPKEIDVSEYGPYSNYNWELLFHVPLTIAVHLSKNQRFAEAQRWFHYIFDPTSTDMSIPPPKRFWKFLAFRKKSDVELIDDLLQELSKTESSDLKTQVERSVEAWRNKPFQPHVIARTRFVAYQFCVVMKYLDNLIAWGDSLFRQDTIETINEATQLYVLAANILGPKPQAIPPKGKTQPKTFAQLRGKLDAFGNALVDLEAQFPFNLSMPNVAKADNQGTTSLFGIGKTLYFCIPKNDKLLGYWDTVADRLFKIRHCMNIEGIVRQLPLFEPPIDPGMLVKAAAAGIDISSLVAGMSQPLSPVRSPLLLQKALEMCAEVRSLGNSLLSTIEKGEGEKLALLRQAHEIKMLELATDVRYLQWKEAESSTEGLLKTRETAFQRYRHYQILLGKKESDFGKLKTLSIERKGLTEENFDEIYQELVGKYGEAIKLEDYPPKEKAGDSSPSNQSGATGQGKLNLNKNEATELNVHLPNARNARLAASVMDVLASVLTFIPEFNINLHFWGLGGSSKLFGGSKLSDAIKIGAEISRTVANWESDQAGLASKTASYERRAEDWTLQSNLAAHELMQIGRQVISSLIREQITKREHANHLQQIEHAKDVDAFLQSKFTNSELYGWMQGELSKIYYECYKFAFDIARKAEQAIKHELMRPEVDESTFIKFNYWDGGRKGLLSGDALYLDLKRMEMAYHEHNKREYELTKHISLRQVNPLALLQLKATGACEVAIPEWVFDLDTPGHYMRRIKTVALSVPCVAGPYASVNCTLSLQKSSIRKSPLVGDGYARQGSEDSRFIDYFGTVQSIVTSNAQNDSGMFEVNLRDERFLPFEGAGVESNWRIELPFQHRQFDYNSISDIVLHIRYTARQGGGMLKTEAENNITDLLEVANASGMVRLFSLRYDFPNEWHRFITTDGSNFKAIMRKDHFPYLVKGSDIEITKTELVGITDALVVRDSGNPWTGDINDNNAPLLECDLPEGEVLVRQKDAEVFLMVRYQLI